MRVWILTIGAAVLLRGQAPEPQTPPADAPAGPQVLQNTGKPMRVPFACTDEDIRSAGLSCSSEEPCAIYLELASVEAVGTQMFVVGNIHSDSHTLYALVLSSADAGKTWREPVERIPGAALDHVRFTDFEHGWIGGQNLYPVPNDPFVLLSTDGGKTWRKRPMFDDQRAGTILQMWFESRNNGAAVLDRGQSTEGMRYELYESATGGESWMVREASLKPPPIRRMPPAAESGWRVRADARSKSFRIEKRGPAQWTPVASFLIELDPCKPAERKPQEPPPALETPAPEPATRPVAPRKPPTLKKSRQ
ncbi:MAG: hypothetical protein ACRD8O_13155 [Bryobacteraceae bacterium]